MPPLDIDKQIQVELLEQEKLKTAMVRHERDILLEDADHARENSREWGKFWRRAFAVLGIAGLLGGAVTGIALWVNTEDPPVACKESYHEVQQHVSERRTQDYPCKHPDNKVKVEEDPEQCGYRRIKVSCTCPTKPMPAPREE